MKSFVKCPSCGRIDNLRKKCQCGFVDVTEPPGKKSSWVRHLKELAPGSRVLQITILLGLLTALVVGLLLMVRSGTRLWEALEPASWVQCAVVGLLGAGYFAGLLLGVLIEGILELFRKKGSGEKSERNEVE